jgi:hypothetical protein
LQEVDKCVADALQSYRTYDAAVDVVSSFEMIFTLSNSDLPSTVQHFERFPSIPRATGDALTPDFTVVFEDGTGLAGEVARIALHENSVDKLVSQLEGYHELHELPIRSDGALASVSQVDVIVIVPFEVGGGAAKRILEERLDAEDHPYCPSWPPCLVQFGFDGGKYIFQRIAHPLNGALRDGSRTTGLGAWFDVNGDFRARPERIRGIRTNRPLINDSVDRLYLATLLWAQVLADLAGTQARPTKISVTESYLVQRLREDYGRMSHREVRDAMSLLSEAGLAELRDEDQWVVAWDELRMKGADHDHEIIARRACSRSRTGPLDRLRRRERSEGPLAQPTLFDGPSASDGHGGHEEP